MDLTTRFYRYLRNKKPNEWQTEDELVEVAKTVGYGRLEVQKTLHAMCFNNSRRLKMFQRKRIKGVVSYRWVESADWEGQRLGMIDWYDGLVCQCESCRSGVTHHD